MTFIQKGPWHRWFAWRPVNTYLYGWRWLVTVERRRYHGDIPTFGIVNGWYYRPTQTQKG